MAKETFNSFYLFLFSPSIEESIAGEKRIPKKEKCPRSHTGGVATPPGFATGPVGQRE
jgi:hypothetical protein